MSIKLGAAEGSGKQRVRNGGSHYSGVGFLFFSGVTGVPEGQTRAGVSWGKQTQSKIHHRSQREEMVTRRVQRQQRASRGSQKHLSKDQAGSGQSSQSKTGDQVATVIRWLR